MKSTWKALNQNLYYNRERQTGIGKIMDTKQFRYVLDCAAAHFDGIEEKLEVAEKKYEDMSKQLTHAKDEHKLKELSDAIDKAYQHVIDIQSTLYIAPSELAKECRAMSNMCMKMERDTSMKGLSAFTFAIMRPISQFVGEF